jgi:coproporphyrinogen III oxidase-like Fe-S oxidoreductase
VEWQFLDEFFEENTPPSDVDLAAIRREWLALRPPYEIAARHLPVPVWARRPFTETGQEAWRTLGRDVPVLDTGKPFCIYVHVPFCVQRCAFCDCYSFHLASHREQHIEGYLNHLAQEMDLWSHLGSLPARPVSTVHFGGGTPTALGARPFGRLVALLRQHFSTGAVTEWALESTASTLTPEILAQLDGLGFTRLHVGVQSLQDDVRQRIGRPASRESVLKVLAQAAAMGWVVSVDLIYGLPGQTLAGLADDILSLIEAGVDGFSLYELQVSARNRRFALQHGLDQQDRRRNYLLGQVASRLLVARGFRKTLFNHFAGQEDTNLYFTFPARGEDCLALGTIADGVFGDYHYRHPEYAAYCREVDGRNPGLEGGLRRTGLESRLQPLTVALMAGAIPPLLLADPPAPGLFDLWQDLCLLEKDPTSGSLCLTGSGSWFVGNMLSEMVGAVSQAPGEKGDG